MERTERFGSAVYFFERGMGYETGKGCMHLPDTAFSAVGGYGTRAGPALVQEEVAAYKKRLDSSNVKYRIMSEEPQADGSVILMIKKQYNQSPVGDYLQ